MRKDIILSSIDSLGRGLEIGPSHSPIAPKKEGYNVDVIDHATQAELREKYSDDNVCLENIEYVDYVWRGEKYSDLLGAKNQYDWIIASHVIEHVPDLVSFLKDCSDVLKDGGVLSLAIPDFRFCFDQFRSVSSLARVLDAHHFRISKPSPGAIVEYYLNISKKNDCIAWSQGFSGQNELLYQSDFALNKYQEALSALDYMDVHTWCFTPSSFRLLIADLSMLGLLTLTVKTYTPTLGSEFFVTLSKGGRCKEDRLALLELMQVELAAPVSANPVLKKKKWYKRFV
jgi:2-polyprenyl-3-methyl-5-hydroxy-6-metoxy-1,4-benzoquinol methylase